MTIRKITSEDSLFVQEKLGTEWMPEYMEEISYEMSVASVGINNEIESFILMKKASLQDYFNGHIPDDEHVQRKEIKNHMAIDAEYFKDNQYEVIAWFSIDNSPKRIDTLYRKFTSLNPIVAWARYEIPFPFTGFYNLNDLVYVDMPPSD